MRRTAFAILLTLCPFLPGAAQEPIPFDRHGDPLPAGALARLGTTRARGDIQAVDISRDGKWIAAAESSGIVRVCAAASGEELHAYPGHVAPVHLALSADGKALFTGDGAGTIRHWDVASGKELRSLAKVHRGGTLLASSADGRTLVSAGQDGSVRQWLVAAGIEVRLLTKHEGPVVALRVVGRKAWSAGLDGVVHQTDLVEGGKAVVQIVPPLGELRGKAATVKWPPVVFSDDAATLAIGKPFGAGVKDEIGLHLWDVEKQRISHALKMPGARATSVAFAPHGRILAVGDMRGNVRVFGVASGLELRQLAPQGKPIGVATALAFDPQGKFLLRADQMLRLLDPVNDESVLLQRAGHGSAIQMIGFGKDGRTVISVGLDRSVLAWDARGGRQITRLDLPAAESASPVLVAPDGQVFCVDNRGKAVRLWRFEGDAFHEVRRFEGLNYFSHLALSRDGMRLAAGRVVGGGEPTVLIWDVPTGKEQAMFKLHVDVTAPADAFGKKAKPAFPGSDPPLVALNFTPNGRSLIARFGTGPLDLWDIASGQKTRALDGKRAGTVAWSPDGRTMASFVSGLRLIEVLTGRERLHVPLKGVFQTAAFSPDGTLLAAGDHAGVLVLIDARSGAELARRQGHKGPITDVAFSPAGDLLASAGSDSTVLIWSDALWKDRPGPARSDLKSEEIALLWSTLRELDAGRAYRVSAALVDAGDATTAFLKEKLLPVDGGDARDMPKWIADLHAESFAVRQKAQLLLESAGDVAVPVLRQAKDKSLPLEVHRRVEAILANLQIPSADHLQTRRGVEILEHIGTPPARAVLSTLSRGAPGFALTNDATEALRRLEAAGSKSGER